MAQASSFLKRKAEERRKILDEQYGASQGGGSAPQASANTKSSLDMPLGGGQDGAPSTRASDFLRKKAEERAAIIDKQYGADAYGGTTWREPDKVAGFNSWLTDVAGLSEQLDTDYTARQGKYQSGADFGRYRDENSAAIARLINRANTYRTYFNDNAALFDPETLASAQDVLTQYGDYLASAQGNLDNEQAFWNQFEDEEAYNGYLRGQEYADLSADYKALGQYGKGNIDLHNRPQYKNPDGSISTVDSASYNIDGKEVLLPTVWMKDGKPYHSHDDEEILQHYEETGEYLGKFDTPEDANAYGEQLHRAQNFYYGSQYKSTANGEKKMNILATLLSGESGGIVYDNPGYDDLLYEWINGNEEAGAIIRNNDANMYGAGSGSLGRLWAYATEGQQQARQMTSEEIAIFNYIYATEGKDAAYQYYDYMQNELNYRNRAADEAYWSEYAAESPFASSLFSMVMSPAKGLSYLTQAADYISSGEIDQNDPYNKFSYIPTAIRTEVGGIVEENWGGVGSFAYNTGMSMGDFLFNTAISGGNQALTLAIMGTGAAADTTISAKDRGLSDGQAFALGTVAGAAEVAMEKLSLDKLFDLKTLGESSLKYVLRNTLTEGGEEVGTELINTLADFIIAQDQSEWNTSIAAYMAEGMSEEEAREQTLKDKALDFGLAGLGGMISGGIISGGGVAVNAAGNYLQNTGAPGVDVSAEAPATVDPAAPSLSADNMTNSDIAAELVNAGSTEAEAETLAPILAAVLTGEEISGNQAGAIAKNEAAVSVLETVTGEAINTDAPLGEVKTTIRSLASRQNAQVEPVAAEDTTAQAQSVEAVETAPAAPTMEAVTQNNVQAVADFAKTMEKAGAAAMTQMYDGGQSAEQYVAGMMRAYNAGKNGTSRAEIINDLQGITGPQAQAAYIAGQADAQNGGTAVARTAEPRYTNLDNNLEGASESDGKTAVYLRNGSQRAGSSYPGGQVSAVEGGAGQNTLRTIQGRPADGEAARLSYGEKVSTASLGIGGGSTKASIRLVTGGETASTKAAKQLAKERGMRLVLFAGDNLSIRQADGTVASVRGMYVSGDRVFVRADHPRYTADQLMRHEAGHDAVAKGEVDIEAVKGRLAELYGEDYAENIAKMYEQAYRGSGISAEGVWEECICDSLGDMNVFDDTEAAKIAEEFLPRVKQAAQDVRGKNGTTRAPPSAKRGSTATGHDGVSSVQRRSDGRGGAERGTQTGGTEVKAKFSMESPVEQTQTLVALHNMHEEKLRSTLKLGAWPSPSIAIVQAATGHADYGAYSAVFPRSTIDPEADYRNRVYGSDAWTPTGTNAPLEYEVNSEAKWRIEDMIDELSGQYAGGAFRRRDIIGSLGLEDTTRDNLDTIARKLASKPAVQAAYLARRGDTLEPTLREKKFDTLGNDALRRFTDSMGVQELAAAVAELEVTNELDSATFETTRDFLLDEWVTSNEWRLKQKPELREKRIENQRGRIDRFRAEQFVRNAWDYYEDGGMTKGEIDTEATAAAMMEQIAPDGSWSDVEDVVRDWIRGELDGLLGREGIYNGAEIFDRMGNRKSFDKTHWPVTVENIVRAMSNADARGANMFGYGAAGLAATATPEYGSVEEIHADEGRLHKVPDDEYKQILADLDAELMDVSADIMATTEAHSSNRFEEQEIIGYIISQAAAGKRTAASIKSTFAREGYTITTEQAKNIKTLLDHVAKVPTGYFEAKPERVVEFNEAVAVLAPSDAPADLISEMEDKGMNVLTYEAGNDQQRLELLNSLEGAKFSRELDSEGRQLTEGQADYFAESKSVDAQGRLKVMYRGGSGDFTVFDRRKSSYSNLYGRGFYFTDSKTHAEQYGNARAFYLNITNPVPTDKRTITRAQMLTFLEAVAENEDDYSFENYGYGATPQSVLRSVFSGKSDFAMLYDVSQTAIGDMVAAVELFNDVNGTDFDGLILDTETVTFRSEQAKSVANENPTSDPDIRYSRELDAIKAEYRDKTDHLYLHEKTDGTISLDNMVVKKAYRDQGVGTQILRDIIAYADATGKTITLTPTSEFGTKARLTKWYKEHGFVENKGRNADYRLSDTMYRLPRSKYSRELENVELLREQNEALREKAEYWKGQTRRTTAENRTVRQADVDKLARQLIKSYGSLLETKDVSGQLKELGDFMVRGGDGKNELTWREMKDRAVVIAKDIIDSAEQLNDEMYQRYSDLRSYLRKTNIIYGKEYHGDIPDFGDFRKRNFGRLNLKTNGRTNLDSVYEEMSEMWPEFFDSAEQTHPTDQLLHIIDVLDSLRPVYENPFSYDMATAVEYVANDIIDGLLGEDVRQTPPTFADRQAAKLDSQKAKDRQKLDRLRAQKNERIAEIRKQGQERTREALRKVRADRDAKIKDLKARYREKDAKARESRRATALRAKIQRHVKELSSTLLRPSDKHHVPEALRGPVARLLEAINLEDNYELEFGRDAKYHRVKPGDSLYAEVTKRTQAFAELRKAYAEIAGELVIDPDLLGDNGAPGLFDEVAALADKPIAAMNTTELETIWQTIRAVEASIRSANKMFTAARFQTVSEAAEALRRDNDGKKAKTEYNYIGGLQKLVGVDMLTPEAFLHRLGDSGDAIFRMMRSAQDEHIRIMKAVADFTHEALSDVNVRTLEKELHTVTLGGEEVKLSTAQLMELYALMRREQAQAHILAGGILPDVVSTKGLKKITKAEPIRGVTLEEVSKALSLLTAEQTAIAEKLQDYASTTLSDFGNKASMAVYNYKKFTEEHYWPIRSNRQETKSTVEKDTATTSVANRGFTKATKPNANTSVKLGSIFDTFSTHASEMATYAAWLGTTEDVNRIRNFTFRDGEGNRTGTVKGIFDRVHGSQGSAYLQKLLSDIANGVKGTHGETEYMGGLVGNYKAASVGANLRVIIQQPTAILRALDMIAPQYLAAGIRPGGWKKALRYAPIAQWKDWGYFDINTGRQMKDVLFDSDSKLEKVKQASMWMAGKMDSLAWGQLWNAVETETKAKHKELKPGTREFYDAVAARFTEIIDRTQVVDGILQRSQIMRSGSGLTKMATAFMGEPTKQYNMLLTSAYDASHATSKEHRTAAKKRLARTVFALSVSSVVNAAAQSIMDAVRDDDKEKDYWDKWLSAFTGFTGEEEGFGEHLAAFWSGNLESIINPAQYIPYAKDVVSILQGYDVSRMDMESIEKTISAAQNMLKALNGEGKYTLAGASANLFAEGARLLGIPVANFKREVKSFAMLAAIESDNYVMQYYMEKTSLNMNYSGNKKTFMDILYNAFANDQEAYELIYADMVESGFDPEKIKSGMETRMKADQGVTKAEELDSRYLSPEQQTQYDRTMGTIRGGSIWGDATAEQQDKVEGYLYDLIVGNSDGAKMQEKIDGGAEYGIDETDYLLYKLALSMVDEPTESGKYGSYTNDEVEAAIKMLEGLSDAERDYLREA